MNKEKFYLYKFLDKKKHVIYIGRTKDIDNRLTKQHFTEKGHLDERCYKETREIEYTEVNTLNEQHIYEIYLISKYQPKYNTQFKGESCAVDFDLPELNWNKFQNEELSSRREYIEIICKIDNEIEKINWRSEMYLNKILQNVGDGKVIEECIEGLREAFVYLVDYKNATLPKKYQAFIK